MVGFKQVKRVAHALSLLEFYHTIGYAFIAESLMQFDVAQHTHIGARKNNQDFVCHCTGPNWGCFMIADGLGGHQAGDIASSYFLTTLKRLAARFAPEIEQNPVQGVECLIHEASSQYRSQMAQEFGLIDAQTTLTLVWVNEQAVVTANVGDSRAYRLQDHQVQWRTADHTVAQRYFDLGKITEEELQNHPMQNRLLRSIKTNASPNAELCLHPPMQRNDTLLLCTDGFWTIANLNTLAELSKSGDKKQSLTTMVNTIAKTTPRSDNVTAQIITLSS